MSDTIGLVSNWVGPNFPCSGLSCPFGLIFGEGCAKTMGGDIFHMSVDTQAEMMERLMGKIQNNLDDIIMTDPYLLDDAEVVIVSYGVSSRTSYKAVDMARQQASRQDSCGWSRCGPFPTISSRPLPFAFGDLSRWRSTWVRSAGRWNGALSTGSPPILPAIRSGPWWRLKRWFKS